MQIDIEDFVKQLRVEIDGDAQLLTAVSAPMQKAMNSMYLAKAWLGKTLGSLGTASPYPKDGSRHSVADIEKTADVSDATPPENWDGKNNIEQIDWLRQDIGRMANNLFDVADADVIHMGDSKENMFMIWSYKALCEARFNLGFELERIKKEPGYTYPEGDLI